MKGSETLRLLDNGLVEAAEILYPFMSGEMPWLGISDVPFTFREPYVEHMKCVKALRPDFEELATQYGHRLYYLGREHMNPYLAVYTKNPITKVEDLKGQKIRIYNIYQEGFFKKAGASPIFMPYAEVPMALAQGVIDGVFTSAGLAPHLKAYDAGIRYETGIFPGFILIGVGVSNKAFDALPADLQAIVEDVFNWFTDMNTAHCYNPVFGDENMDADREIGMTVLPPIPEISNILEEYSRETDWVKFQEDAGAKGTEVLRKMLAAQGRTLD